MRHLESQICSVFRVPDIDQAAQMFKDRPAWSVVADGSTFKCIFGDLPKAYVDDRKETSVTDRHAAAQTKTFDYTARINRDGSVSVELADVPYVPSQPEPTQEELYARSVRIQEEVDPLYRASLHTHLRSEALYKLAIQLHSECNRTQHACLAHVSEQTRLMERQTIALERIAEALSAHNHMFASANRLDQRTMHGANTDVDDIYVKTDAKSESESDHAMLQSIKDGECVVDSDGGGVFATPDRPEVRRKGDTKR